MSRQKALIVDDEPDIRELLEITLGRMKLDTRSARNVKEAKEYLAREPFDLCLTDMRLPDGTGMDLVQHIQQRHPQVPVAMITAFGSLDTAVNALKAGAFDFLTKPVDLGRLRELVATALRLRSPGAEDAPVDNRLLGDSPPMRQMRNQIAKLARSQAPVYISGESGSGKELVARLIHEQGPRSEVAFVPVNCGAIPSELMESEFFGHKKGSFTGAVEDKQGLFQAANGGTLFLDEVADLPLPMQVKLLRAIQEKAVRAVGGQQEVAVDVRVLCATHKDLAAEVAAGAVRERELEQGARVVRVLGHLRLHLRYRERHHLLLHCVGRIAIACDGAREGDKLLPHLLRREGRVRDEILEGCEVRRGAGLLRGQRLDELEVRAHARVVHKADERERDDARDWQRYRPCGGSVHLSHLLEPRDRP